MANARAVWLARHVLPIEPLLRAWLRRRAVPGLETDDIVQEVYGILAGLPSVDSIRDPKSYTFSVARSVVLRHLRRAKIISIVSLAEIDELSIPDIGEQPDSNVLRHQELHRLIEHVGRLPEKCREVFILCKLEGRSQAEVAARLGIAESTVEKHIGKGLHAIMKFIGSESDADSNHPRSNKRQLHVQANRQRPKQHR